MTLALTVQHIIRTLCGGPDKVADASKGTDHPITAEAALKWYRNGIPERHWPLVRKLTGLAVDQIYAANRVVEQRKSERRKARRRRAPRLKRGGAQAAA